MQPVKQQFKHDPANGVYGDCHRAAIATALGLPLAAVPHFGDGDPPADEFFAREAVFLASHGLRSVQLPVDGLIRLDETLSMVERLNGDVVYLLGGMSRTGVNHTVVCKGGAIAHDPSLTDSGITGPCSDGYYWLTFFAPADLVAHTRALGRAAA